MVALVAEMRGMRESEGLCDDETEKDGDALALDDAESVSVRVFEAVAEADTEAMLCDAVLEEAGDCVARDAVAVAVPLAATLTRFVVDGLWLVLGEDVVVTVAVKETHVVSDTRAEEELDGVREERADAVARLDLVEPSLPDTLEDALGLAVSEGERVPTLDTDEEALGDGVAVIDADSVAVDVCDFA